MAAKEALAHWSSEFDYRAAAGQSYDSAMAALAAEYAASRGLVALGAKQLRQAASRQNRLLSSAVLS